MSSGANTYCSVLAGFLIDHFSANANADFKIAYFFCTDKQDKQKSAESLLRGLIHQLIGSTPELVEHALSFYKSQNEKMIESLGTLADISLSCQ